MWKWCSPLLLQILFGASTGLPQEEDPEKRIRIQDPIRNWSARIFEKNDKGEHVLVGELFGEEARPLDKDKSRFRINQIRAIYHTQPKKPGEKSQKLNLTAPEAEFDQTNRIIHLYKKVESRSKDGTLLQTRNLRLDLSGQRFSTADTFLFARPGITIKGKGLDADDTLGTFTILEHPEVDATGESSGILSLQKTEQSEQHLRLTCQGPMTVRRVLDNQNQSVGAWVHATQGTHILLENENQQAEISCDTAKIFLHKNPETGKFDLERAELEAIPHLTVQQGSNHVQAERGIIEWSTNRSHFTGNVTGSFVPKKGSKPVQFRAQELTDLGDKIHAAGTVELDGLLEDQEEKTIATCDRFSWHKEQEAGTLFGKPWVVIQRGTSTLRAARILVPNPNALILQGPKRVRMKQDHEDRSEVIAFTAKGDISVALDVRRIQMANQCSVFSEDFRLSADRIDVQLPEKGKGSPQIRAAGEIQIHRKEDGIALFGDQMESGGTAFTVRGWPYATLLQQDLRATMEEVHINPETEALEGFRGTRRIRIRLIEKE